MAEELFPREFIEQVRKDIPKAVINLELAEKRLAVAKAAGADVPEQERRIFELRQRISKIKAAFHIT